MRKRIIMALLLFCMAILYGILVPAPVLAAVPDDTLSRAEFLAILGRYDGSETAAGAVSWAISLGLLEDMASEDFDPNAPLSREEMMVILYNYAISSGLTFPAASPPSFFYNDEKQISPYAKEAVLAGYWAKIMEGFPLGDFKPQGQVTRIQAETVLSRFTVWKQIRAAHPHASSDISGADSYDLTGLITKGADILITENGLLAAHGRASYESDQEQAILYNLNTRQLLAVVPIENESYCRRIDETASGVNFTVVEYLYEDEDFVGYDVKNLDIDWQGNASWQHPGDFRLPFGTGELAEEGRNIVYIDGKSGQKKILATYNEEDPEYDGEYARLVLYSVLDENRFVYVAEYDSWSLATYIYDKRTEQSTLVHPYSGYFLGFGGNRLLTAFGQYGTEGMVVTDLSSMKTLCQIYYNDAGPSRAALSPDGELVMAFFQRGGPESAGGIESIKSGFWLYSAQTGQLLEEYSLTALGTAPLRYGFWQQRIYFLSGTTDQTILYILPENMAGFPSS